MLKQFYKIGCLAILPFCCSCTETANEILIEAESFTDKGGWELDTQSIPQMGSPYLLAHGMGKTVKNAQTTFDADTDGNYRLWVRTRNWTKPWNEKEAAGKFNLLINGQKVKPVFGTEEAYWHWQDGGIVKLQKEDNRLELQDLTGFDGRCDAIYFTSDLDALPPTNQKTELDAFRKELLGISSSPEVKGNYDLVVVGGGMAGCCAAISAARLGCKVALIQNRPVLGGNNSSEVRVGLSGLIMQEPYPNLGNLNDELGGVGYWNNVEAKGNPQTERSQQILQILKSHPEKHIHNAGPKSNYEDDKKKALVQQHENIDLFLNTQVIEVNKKDNKIVSVLGKDTENSKEYLFEGTLFCDCTGDGDVGYLAGADYRMGRESKAETAEPRAPEKADSLVMGTSVQWYADEKESASTFPACAWAVQFNDETCVPLVRGDWDWEAGLNKNQIADIEEIRDYALRAVYGNWSYLKNSDKYKEQYANKELAWVAYIGGKRESRRLLGDVVLKEQDVLNQVPYDDASFTTTWGVDLHYPKPIEGMKEDPFLTYADVHAIKPYAVPYRCLYSRNIDNLFMAGRNISVTHVALGTIRVMRTGGMMGEVVGMASAICKEHQTSPRGVYQHHLPQLKQLMEKGVGKRGF